MNWERGDPYYLKTEGFTICRVNIGKNRVYELWDLKSRECIASGKAKDDVEAAKVVKYLKDVAEAA